MKIDFLYSFHFNEEYLKDNIFRRFRASIRSIISQKVNVCVCNTSNKCVYNKIKDLGKIKYVHKPTNNFYCKPLTINYGVKNLVTTPYFILSDIDLVYPKNYIEIMKKYFWHGIEIPRRVVTYNYNIGKKYITSNYDLLFDKFIKTKKKDDFRTFFGISPGNGLIHLKSFYTLRGFEEDMFGYGPEDADFNMRISYINKYIETDHKDLATIHLYHSFAKLGPAVDKNFEIYSKRKTYFANRFTKEPFSYRKHLGLIQSNRNKNWGIIY